MTTQQREILTHWDAYIYEQQEDSSAIARCVLRMLGVEPLRVLEVACGGGKLCAPLAEAGHDVTGFDLDEEMLLYARQKAEKLPNLRLYRADAFASDWGSGFDAVILGANLMVNLDTEWDYRQAQKQLIERAHRALKPGGHLFVDFDCPDVLSHSLGARGEWVCFEGRDDRGTSGRYIVLGSATDDASRVSHGGGRYEITTREGESFAETVEKTKHWPTLEQTCAWLYRAGFTVERLYGGHEGEPFDEAHRRAVIWARA